MLPLVLLACAPAPPPVPHTPEPAEDPPPEPEAPPEAPEALLHWLTGNAADAEVDPLGPGLILMGGGRDVDDAFSWWQPRVAGGDVVVLRTSGEDGYNPYLAPGVDSVETLRVDTRALADDPYVAYRVRTAEGIFLAGGDQSTYMESWADTALSEALQTAWDRGAVIGGTSAGCAVLGEVVFSAENGTVYSDEVLEDPYNPYVTLADPLHRFPPLAGVITDSHVQERDRLGRLLGFVARMKTDGLADTPIGLGIDERTALVIDAEGLGTVVGDGGVSVVIGETVPTACEAGEPLVYADVPYHRLFAGDTVKLPAGVTDVTPEMLTASGGMLSPQNPY